MPVPPAPDVTTALDASMNMLQGPIPASWSTRQETWVAVNVTGNADVCGALPSWFTARFVSNGAMIGGARRRFLPPCSQQRAASVGRVRSVRRARCPASWAGRQGAHAPSPAHLARHARARAVLAHR